MQQLPLPGREAQRQGPKGNAQVGAPTAVCNAGSITCASAADTPRTPIHRQSSRSAAAVWVVFRIASLLLLQGAACRHHPVERGKASQVQEPEPPPTPNCHGCVRKQSVMKCMTSRCAAWFIKDDMVWKPVNKWENLRRIPFKAEHSNTKCFSSPTPCTHSRHSRSDRGIPARRQVTDGRV